MAVSAGCAPTAPRPASPGPEATTTPVPTPGPNDFDRAAALATLHEAGAHAGRCTSSRGPRGHYRIAVTFALDGHVTRADIEGHVTNNLIDGPFERVASDGEVRSCVEGAFRAAKVPPFQGAPVTVHKSFLLDSGNLDRGAP